MSKVEVTKLSEGTRPVLFAVHASGGILAFAKIARHLHPEQPCYLLKGKGIDSVHHSFKDCYDLARNYVAEILRIQPDGPFMIFGRQSETVIEVGQQLMQCGKTVSLTVIFDSGPPKHKFGGRTPSGVRRFLYRCRKNVLDLTSFLFDWVRTISNEISTRSRSADKLSLKDRVRFKRFARKRSIEAPTRINQDLMSGYIAKHYPAKVVFIQSVEHRSRRAEYIHLWRAVADEVVYHTAPGEHSTMFNTPHVYILADLVQKECDNVTRNLASDGQSQHRSCGSHHE